MSSKTVRPHAPCGAQCIGHAVSTWSAVCSEVPHSQFGEGLRPHLHMDEWNRPTPVCRQLSLTQAAWGKPIPTGLASFGQTSDESSIQIKYELHPVEIRKESEMIQFVQTLTRLDSFRKVLFKQILRKQTLLTCVVAKAA